MAIEKIILGNGEIRYRPIVRSKDGKKLPSQLFRRKIDAQKLEVQLKEQREKTPLPDTEKVALNALWKRYFEKHALIHHAPGTRINDKSVFEKHVIPHLGTRDIEGLRALDLENLFCLLAQSGKVSNQRINRVRVLMYRIMQFAVRQKLVSVNPVAQTKALPCDKALEAAVNYLSQDETRSLLDWCQENDPWLYPKVMVLVNTGLRFGEMVALRASDLRPTETGAQLQVSRTYCKHSQEVRPRTKGRRSRVFPLGAVMRKFLTEIGGGRVAEAPLLWNDWIECRHRTKFNKHFTAALKGAEVRRIRVHDLRHTFAVHFLERGGHLYDLQQLLGHSTPELTQRYSHFSKEMTARCRGLVEHQAGMREKPQLTVVEGGAANVPMARPNGANSAK